MPFDTFIDSVAAFTKFGIEISGQTPESKKLAETQVDCLSALLKLSQPFPSQRSNSVTKDFEWVKRIKKIAQQYFVDRIVLFPYPVDNWNLGLFMHAYGGETTKFFEQIGFSFLKRKSITPEENASLVQWENEYGIILHESQYGRL